MPRTEDGVGHHFNKRASIEVGVVFVSVTTLFSRICMNRVRAHKQTSDLFQQWCSLCCDHPIRWECRHPFPTWPQHPQTQQPRAGSFIPRQHNLNIYIKTHPHMGTRLYTVVTRKCCHHKYKLSWAVNHHVFTAWNDRNGRCQVKQIKGIVHPKLKFSHCLFSPRRESSHHHERVCKLGGSSTPKTQHRSREEAF